MLCLKFFTSLRSGADLIFTKAFPSVASNTRFTSSVIIINELISKSMFAYKIWSEPSFFVDVKDNYFW